MKLRIRTLSNSEEEVTVDGTDSVACLKEKTALVFKNMVAERIIIIHKGKILSDSNTLNDYSSLKDGDVLIAMMQKEKPQAVTSNPQEVTADAPSNALDANSMASQQRVTGVDASQELSGCTSAPTDTTATLSNQNDILLGEELEQTIQNICSMGFERDRVLNAMRSAYNNPSRAVEYLMTGFPEAPVTDRVQATNDMSANAVTRLAEELRQNPELDQIRHAIRANPQLFQEFVQSLSTQNPAIAELIANNEADFLHLAGDDERTTAENGRHGESVQINVTEEQHASIQKLHGFGFSEDMCFQALTVCEWDEELALNYLYDSLDD